MKRIISNFAKFSTLIVLGSALFFTSCSEDEITEEIIPSPPEVIAEASSNSVVSVPFFVRNHVGQLPVDPDDQLYESRKGNPVLAPNGDHVTWGDFEGVTGNIEVECNGEGTKVVLKVNGLIPDGQYTIWNVTFEAPGMDPTDPMLGADGLGAGGIGDGSDNAFVADARGRGSIELTSPGGPLSMLGSIGDCALLDNFEWHVVGAYHMNGRTYGGDLGPSGTAVEHFGFIFRNKQ